MCVCVCVYGCTCTAPHVLHDPMSAPPQGPWSLLPSPLCSQPGTWRKPNHSSNKQRNESLPRTNECLKARENLHLCSYQAHKQNYEHIFIFPFLGPWSNEMIRWIQQAPRPFLSRRFPWECVSPSVSLLPLNSFAAWSELSGVSDLLFAHLWKW